MKVKESKIKKINIKSNEDVYDLTVMDNHNFFANKLLVHNCGEITLCPYDSCRLLAINLYSYVVFPFTKDAYFDFELFSEHVQYAQRFMDDIIDLELEKIDKILEKIITDPEDEHIKRTETELWLKIKEMSEKGRRTGLGVTAEGDMIAALGLRYGTKPATEFSTKVHKTIAINAYKSSAIMAEERGSFPVYDYEKEINNPFISRLKNDDPELDDMLKTKGRRNIALLTIAPTGCMVEDTKIKTDNGNITLAQLFLVNGYNLEKLRGLNDVWLDVNKDIYVYNLNGKKNKITKLYWNGEVKTKKLKLNKGIEVEISNEHKFLVKLNDKEAIWKKVEELSIGDKIIQKI